MDDAEMGYTETESIPLIQAREETMGQAESNRMTVERKESDNRKETKQQAEEPCSFFENMAEKKTGGKFGRKHSNDFKTQGGFFYEKTET
ncbi:MAG: hypothetical protein OSJ52_04115 [Lachnospiraceae bacterium]|jgi:hypothetical protein|nr:hypothetical protein [Lachnospiraceae bacterium]